MTQSLDLWILKFLSLKENFDVYSFLIDNTILTKEAHDIFKEMSQYFQQEKYNNPIQWVSSFKPYYFLKYNKKEKNNIYTHMFNTLDSIDIKDTPKDLINNLIDRDHTQELREIISRIEVGSATFSEVEECIELRQKDLEKYKILKNGLEEDDFQGALEELTAPSGFTWPLSYLQESLGPLRKGDFVLLGGRPGICKTTLVAYLIGEWLKNTSQEVKIVLFNNEERNSKVRFRIVQSTLMKTTKQIQKDPKLCFEQFKKLVGDLKRVHVADCSDWNTKQVEQTLKELKPDLIIFDQLSKLRGHDRKTGNEAERLSRLAAVARRWANNYAPIISTIWADSTAEGQRFIGQHQLYGSKTGVVGECDAIITVGADTMTPDIIGFNVPRNKLIGEDETMRNAKFEIQLLAETAQFKIP